MNIYTETLLFAKNWYLKNCMQSEYV